MSLLHVENLGKTFGGLRAVKSLSFEAAEGQIVGLIGPNGAGKTTAFHLITGFLRSDTGQVVFDGKNTRGLLPHHLAALGLVRTFQQAQPFAKLTTLENVVVGALLRHQSVAEAAAAAAAALQRVGMIEKRDRRAKDLTIGDMKRLEIARVLATSAKMILLDEAMAGLTPAEIDEVVALILDLRRTEGITFLVVEHVMRAVMRLSDRIIVLHHGEKIADGRPTEVVRDKYVIEAYLGEELDIA